MFGGPAWTRVPDGQWYLHLFAPEQPDLNWNNPEVATEFARILRFWLDRGADGFRIDVAHGMAKPEGLPDMEVLPTIHNTQMAGDPRFDQPAVHEYLRGLRAVMDEYPGAMAVGEVWAEYAEKPVGVHPRRRAASGLQLRRWSRPTGTPTSFRVAVQDALDATARGRRAEHVGPQQPRPDPARDAVRRRSARQRPGPRGGT